MIRFSPSYLFLPLGILLLAGCGGEPGESEFRKGIEAYREKNYERAIDLLSQAEKRIKDSAELYYYLGASYLAVGKMGESYAALEVAQEYDTSMGETLAAIGHIAYQKDNFKNAEGYYRSALKSSLKTPEAKAMILNGLSLICRKRKEESRALLYLFMALKEAPGYSPTYYNLGHLYKYSYDLGGESLEQFNRYLQLEEKGSVHYAKARNHVAALTEAVKEEEKARAARQAGLKRDPKKALSLLEKAMDYHTQKRYPLAARTYRNALKADPTLFNAAWGWGITSREQALRVDALEAFQKATELKPDYIDAYIHGAEQAFFMRRYDQARKILVPAMAKKPLYAPTFELLIKISYAQKRFQEVKELGEYYLSLLKPEDPNYAKYKSWLKDI